MPSIWETTERTYSGHKHIPTPTEHFVQITKSTRGHTYYPHAPPTHKRPSHSPTQQISLLNSPHTPIQQAHKVLYPIKCRQLTQLAPRHHDPIMVYTMHMPLEDKHGRAKTWHIMSTRPPHRGPCTHTIHQVHLLP